MAASQRDRYEKLRESTVLNGIDFVEIATGDQKTLRIHFLNAVAPIGPLNSRPTIEGGESIPSVRVLPVAELGDWSLDAAGRPVLTLRVETPGDFSFYTLTLDSPSLDFFYRQARFSFKA